MSDGYLARHWRGELSLAKSYWLNKVLLGGVLAAALSLSLARIARPYGEQPILVLYLTASLLLLLAYCQTWQFVGAWRSADRVRREEGRLVRSRAVQVLVALNVASSGAAAVMHLVPPLRATLGDTPIPVAGATVRDHGQRIDFYGPVGPASAAAFRQALAAGPAAKLVRLESRGGNVAQARQIAGMIRARGLDTEVTQSCISACTIMFFGGTRRRLGDGARLGFHSYSSAAMTPQDIVRSEEVERRAYAGAGVAPGFIERIFAVPPAQVWYPTAAELSASGFVNVQASPLAAAHALCCEGSSRR